MSAAAYQLEDGQIVLAPALTARLPGGLTRPGGRPIRNDY
jgi:hypothetical protein